MSHCVESASVADGEKVLLITATLCRIIGRTKEYSEPEFSVKKSTY